MRQGDWVQTYTGRQYWPVDPSVDDVHIIDIAHSLSMVCRYGGHCREFYSVAEHCFHVSTMVPPEHALHALLHDATEAYCLDVPRPLKPFLTNYRMIEARNWLVICERFGINPDMPAEVTQADHDILLTEKKRLLGASPAQWVVPGAVERDNPPPIWCLTPARAERVFLDRFRALTATC